jgi:hypothetical protein
MEGSEAAITGGPSRITCAADVDKLRARLIEATVWVIAEGSVHRLEQTGARA